MPSRPFHPPRRRNRYRPLADGLACRVLDRKRHDFRAVPEPPRHRELPGVIDRSVAATNTRDDPGHGNVAVRGCQSQVVGHGYLLADFLDNCRENRAAASVVSQRETSLVMVFSLSAGGTHCVGVCRSSANTVSGFRFLMRPRHDLLENRVITTVATCFRRRPP